ncbi:AAA family ATPase [Methanolobus sp. ZRKC2]|uniref:McrB family protein n=1 Tax=Methanolobus sp. ZRKC2 TaxID=3125783 RepID=UPI0032533ACE
METEIHDQLLQIPLKEQKLYKMSHGAFKLKKHADILEILKQNNWIVLHESTKKGQAERFKNTLDAGDYVYITVGGDEVYSIAKIKPGPWQYVPEDITGESGWIYREVEYIKPAIKKYPYGIKHKRNDIYPSGNSTLSEITPKDLNEANEILFKPYFGVEFISDKAPPVKKEDDLPKHPCNIILYGPPGTGKTYNTIDRAVEIITGYSGNHDENKEVFDSLREEGQIEFVTFHQNYGYEDFMVGIRPDLDDSDLKFKRTEGIFYKLCKRAEQNYLQFQNIIDALRPFDEVFFEFMEPLETENKEIEVKMLSGKVSFWITDIDPDNGNISFRNSVGKSSKLNISTLKGLYEGTKELNSGRRSYFDPLVNELLERGKEVATQVPLKRYVLIIDEINRANISKVFGELITLLEEDKRIGANNELMVNIPNEDKVFGVPPNLYLIGTMNTADKSIALIDIALRRRFEFIGYFPDYTLLSDEKRSILRHINKEIHERKKSADYLIGHGYFMNSIGIPDVLSNKVIPLLMEYFSGKTDIVEEIFKGSSWSVKYDTEQYDWQIQQ